MQRAVAKRIAGALVVSVGGTATVFGLMLLMNGFSQPPQEPDFEKKTKFSVESEPDPPKKKPEPKQEEPKKQSPKESVEPPPDLGAGVGTMDLDLPGFEPTDMQGASKKMLGDVQASAMTADSVDKKPQPMRRVDPNLPRRVVSKQIEGHVIAKALVDAQGRVVEVRIVEAEPKGVFEGPVEEAVRQWQFQPASYEGKAVKTWVEVPFHFELS